MSTHFEDKSPTEILDGVSGYANPELDALAAKYCDGREIRFNKRWGWQSVNEFGARRVKSPTTNWREAGQLLEKYKIGINWSGGHVFTERQNATTTERNCVFFDYHRSGAKLKLRRAITKAAIIAGLTKIIEEP